MSTVQEIESAIRRLSPDEMRAVRDWLENLLEDQLAFTPEFESQIARSEKEMSAGLKPRTGEPRVARARTRVVRALAQTVEVTGPLSSETPQPRLAVKPPAS